MELHTCQWYCRSIGVEYTYLHTLLSSEQNLHYQLNKIQRVRRVQGTTSCFGNLKIAFFLHYKAHFTLLISIKI